jgi:transcriptional regulator with XRE-family HTH domain
MGLPDVAPNYLDLIRKAVAERFDSQLAAAEALELSASYLSRILGGTRRPSAKTLKRLLDKLEIPRALGAGRLYLESVPSNKSRINTFIFDRDNPKAMIEQLLEWYGDLPPGVRRALVRSTMRTLEDEAFTELVPAPTSWIFSLRSIDRSL